MPLHLNITSVVLHVQLRSLGIYIIDVLRLQYFVRAEAVVNVKLIIWFYNTRESGPKFSKITRSDTLHFDNILSFRLNAVADIRI